MLTRDDGQLTELAKTTLESIRVAPVEAAPAEAHPASPSDPQPVEGASVCLGDEFCEYPRKCIGGECRIDPAYVEALELEGDARRKGGLITLAIGAPLAVIGAVMGAVIWEVGLNCEGAGGKCNQAFDRRKSTAIAGFVFAGIGGALAIPGGIAFGVGRGKLKRAKQYRRSLQLGAAPSPTGLSVGLRGRY